MEKKEKEKKKLFAYCRVSTEYQKEKHNIETQEFLINKYIDENKEKYEVIDWFRDDGISAFSYRPKFDEMMSRIEECDGIIFTKLDRVGRSNRHLAEFGDILLKKRKDFIVTDKKESIIDTTTKYGKLLFGMLSVFAEFEATLINERMMEGRAKHIADGGKIGRNIIDLKEYEKYIKEMYSKSYGTTMISKFLKEKYGIKVSYATLLNRLKKWNIQIKKPKNKKQIAI